MRTQAMVTDKDSGMLQILKGTEKGYVVAILAPEEFERLVKAISIAVIEKLWDEGKD